METLTLRFLGPPSASWTNSNHIHFPTRKAQQLFQYLVLHRHRTHTRSTLAGLFWGDAPDEHARKNLRTTLWRLRSLLEPAAGERGIFLEVGAEEVRFKPRGPYWLDVREFEDTLTRYLGPDDVSVQGLGGEGIRDIETAIALYAGDLLEGCDADWCLYERQRLQLMLIKALSALMMHHGQHGSFERAIHYGWRILTYDPLLETVHRELIRLHDLAGNRPAAIRQYQRLRAVLARELAVEPMPETTALYEEIRRRSSLVPPGPLDRSAAAQSRSSRTVGRSAMDHALVELRGADQHAERLRGHLAAGITHLEALRKRFAEFKRRK